MKTSSLSLALMLVCSYSWSAPEPAGGASAGTAPATRPMQVAQTAPARSADAPASAAGSVLRFPVTGTLYQRLGGQEGVTAIVREATRNHLKNPVHKTRFEVMADPARVERMLIEYFSQVTGGPVVYTGKNMVAAHRGMNINGQEFLAFMDDIVGAMDSLGVGAGAKSELIGLMYRGKEQVMHK
jgi:hemoglobin